MEIIESDATTLNIDAAVDVEEDLEVGHRAVCREDLTSRPDELGDRDALPIVTEINGEVRQDDTTANLIFGVPELERAETFSRSAAILFTTLPRMFYEMPGGTLIALAADEIVLGEFSVLGPIDPQILGFPAASIVKARDAKPPEHVFDLTFVLADVVYPDDVGV